MIVAAVAIGIAVALGLGRWWQISRTGSRLPQTLTVRAVDLSFEPAEATLRAGEVTVTLTNAGTLEHNFVLTDAAGKDLFGIPEISSFLRTGQSAVRAVRLAAGTYPYYCHYQSHYQLGMKGVLVVK
jgi:plastocyanin